MNQDARKAAKTKVEKDSYKLLNNSNFGYDCRITLAAVTLSFCTMGWKRLSLLKNIPTYSPAINERVSY